MGIDTQNASLYNGNLFIFSPFDRFIQALKGHLIKAAGFSVCGYLSTDPYLTHLLFPNRSQMAGILIAKP